MKRAALILLVAFLASAAPAIAAERPADPAQADPTQALGGTSPSCRYGLDARGRAACARSGTPTRDYPLSSYGLDVRVGFSVTDPGKSFQSALQSIGAALWTGLLYLVHATLLLLEWAFSLDLTGQAMPEARRALQRLHQGVFGEPWLLAAISVAGVWGIWRGLVQRRVVETMTGLAATVVLIVGAMVLIAKPGETVGAASAMTNDGGLAVLAAATGGDTADPRRALSGTLRRVFDATVRDPWCALQFGSIAHCDARTGDRRHATVGDLWLAFPAQSWQRERLEVLTRSGKQDDGGGLLNTAGDLLGFGDDRRLPDEVARLVTKQPERVQLQEAGGTFPRLALLAMVSVGLLGAVALFAYLGVRILLASALTIVLLLLAPAMLLAPAFGDSGRATFIAWFKRLVGALVAKLIYAVLLAVVLATGQVFTALDVGWFGTWLVLSSFWWGVFLKRYELTEFVTVGTPHHDGTSIGRAVSQAFYGWQLTRAAGRGAAALARPATAAGRALADDRLDARTARTAATSQLAGERVDAATRSQLGEDVDEAREAVGVRQRLQAELRAVDRRLAQRDEAVAAANAQRKRPPTATTEQQALIEHREHLRRLLADRNAGEAEHLVHHADRNRALTGVEVTQADLDVHRAAGLRRLDQADDSVAPEDAKLLRAADRDAQPADLRSARRLLDDDELRQRTSAEHARLRAERRQRRQQGRRR